MNPKRDAAPSQGLLKFVLVGSLVLLGLVSLYHGALFSYSFDGRFIAKRDFGQVFEVGELDPEVPKSIPVCDLRYSELIPCLDRNMMSRMKLKLNLSLMEHYERHCPQPEHRYNCLIPPPPGYKFALERGIPATLGVLGTRRLPYPSRSFELAHCSRCRIDWLQRDGILLLELDRLLRPGGYFVFSSPEAYAHDVENQRIWSLMHDLLRRMCWRVVARKEQTVIWAKPLSNSCYRKRTPGILPVVCSSDDDPDATWNVLMKGCITPYSAKMHGEKGSGLVPWPRRLTAPPPRLEEIGTSIEEFQNDMNVWHYRVVEYWKQMKSVISGNSLRNIMDMGSNLGGFAAALNDKDVWVMNVAPVNESSKLKIIYDRGLIGTVHDWCESFSTYPRTYDLLHAWSIFSQIEERGCSSRDLLIEMDRILRPEGFVVIRDSPSVINYVRKFLASLKWDGWSSEVEPIADALSTSDERVLIARKRLWDDNHVS